MCIIFFTTNSSVNKKHSKEVIGAFENTFKAQPTKLNKYSIFSLRPIFESNTQAVLPSFVSQKKGQKEKKCGTSALKSGQDKLYVKTC